MVWLAALGGFLGIAFAFFVTRRRRGFRKKLLQDLEHHRHQGTLKSFVMQILQDKKPWLVSLSWVRKPFSKEMNLVVETAAWLLGVMALVTSIGSFDRVFKSAGQGVGVILFLGAVLAYIPSERFFTRRIDEEIDTVWKEMEEALSGNRLEEYVESAANRWVGKGGC